MHILGILLFCIITIMVPVMIGTIYLKLELFSNDSLHIQILESYVLGFFSMIALFHICYIPCYFFQTTFTTLCIIYSILLCIVICGVLKLYQNDIVLFIRNKKFKKVVTDKKQILSYIIDSIKSLRIVYFISAIALFLYQLYYTVFYTVGYWTYDDYAYVVRSTVCIATNRIITSATSISTMGYNAKRSLCAWEVFIAYIAKVTGINVTVVAHTLLAAILLIIAYIIFYLISTFLFDQQDNRYIFMILLSILNIFGYYTHASLSFRLLATIWQGKAVCMALVIPFLFYYISKLYQYDYNEIYGYILSMIALVGVTTTPTGIGLVLMVIGLLTLLGFIYKRKLLYIWYIILGSIVPVIQFLLFYFLK